MDLFWIIVVCMICMILFSICGWCCRSKRQGTVYGYGTNVTVVPPTVTNPYPPHQMPPMSQGGPPHPGYGMPMPPQPGGPGPQVYPPVPYPPPTSGPYPPAPGPAPYPPQAGIGFGNEPPPYHVAMSQPHPGGQQITPEAYGKQAPYNPNYNS